MVTEPAAPKPKRPKRVSPTQRTLGECRARGWIVQVVERWQSFFGKKGPGPSGVRVDLFGVIDLVAIVTVPNNVSMDASVSGETWNVRPTTAILGIQACAGSGGSPAARMAKAAAEPRLRAWLAAGGKFEVWAWRKTNDRTKGARKLWSLRRVEAELCGGAVAWHEVEEVEP